MFVAIGIVVLLVMVFGGFMLAGGALGLGHRPRQRGPLADQPQKLGVHRVDTGADGVESQRSGGGVLAHFHPFRRDAGRISSRRAGQYPRPRQPWRG